MTSPPPPTPSSGLPSIGSTGYSLGETSDGRQEGVRANSGSRPSSARMFRCFERGCTTTYHQISWLLNHSIAKHKFKFCPDCFLAFDPSEHHKREHCAEGYCISEYCLSSVEKSDSCNVMCQRHIQQEGCHTWRQLALYDGQAGRTRWTYLKGLYDALQSAGALDMVCPVHGSQPSVPPNDEQVTPSAICNECVALDIENSIWKKMFHDEVRKSAELEKTNQGLLEKLALLEGSDPSVQQYSTQNIAPPTTFHFGIPAIPSGFETGYNDTSMSRDSGYASIPPAANFVSGNTNMNSYDHSVNTGATTNASSMVVDEPQTKREMQDTTANDSIDASHMFSATGDSEMFPMDMETDSTPPANARETMLLLSDFSSYTYNQNSRPHAQEYNPSAQQGGPLGSSDINMTPPWLGDYLQPRE